MARPRQPAPKTVAMMVMPATEGIVPAHERAEAALMDQKDYVNALNKISSFTDKAIEKAEAAQLIGHLMRVKGIGQMRMGRKILCDAVLDAVYEQNMATMRNEGALPEERLLASRLLIDAVKAHQRVDKSICELLGEEASPKPSPPPRNGPPVKPPMFGHVENVTIIQQATPEKVAKATEA